MALEKIARFKPGENVSVLPTEDITAGTFVEIVGGGTGPGETQIGGVYGAKPASANNPRPFGVAERSVAAALDSHYVDKLTNVARRGAVARVLCEGQVKPGEEVYIAGAGKVKKIAAEKFAVGRCVRGGTDTYIEVDVY